MTWILSGPNPVPVPAGVNIVRFDLYGEGTREGTPVKKRLQTLHVKETVETVQSFNEKGEETNEVKRTPTVQGHTLDVNGLTFEGEFPPKETGADGEATCFWSVVSCIGRDAEGNEHVLLKGAGVV